MTCTRESKAGGRKEHIKECLKCQCIVCKDWLLEHCEVTDRESKQTGLEDF